MIGKVKNLGAHTSVKNLSEFKDYTDIFQCFLHSPMAFTVDEEKMYAQAQKIREATPGLVVIHSPYWLNIQSKNRLSGLTKKSIYLHLDACVKQNFPYFVMHTGSSKVKNKKTGEETIYSEQETFDWMVEQLKHILGHVNGSPVKVLLENTANLGTKGVSVGMILSLVLYLKERGFNNLGLCFDIAHAFARGEKLENLENFMEAADVIHFNSVPEKVKWGQGLDRHTNTPLNESYGIEPLRYLEWLKKFENKVKILEMDTNSALESFEFVKNREA